MITEVTARTARLATEVTSPDLKKTFFTLSSADAIKIVKLYTGRSKIISRHRSYHGPNIGALSASGDPRRLPVEPGIPGVVHIHDPYCYRCLSGQSQESCNLTCADYIDLVTQFEGPESIAAIALECVGGSSGIVFPRNPEH